MVITLELWPARGRNRTGARTVIASELTDGQWNLIKDLFVERPTGGRPRVAPRPCLEGILWVLRSGARWKKLTTPVPVVLHMLAATERVDGCRALRRGVATSAPQARRQRPDRLAGGDGRRRFCVSKKGGSDVGPTKRGKGSKLMLLVDGKGLPLAVSVHSASSAEVTLIEPLLDRHVLGEHSIRLIYDRAADSDPLRERLSADGIELICPHRKNRKRPPIQDGRSLKRYRKRCTIERTMAWLQSYRRLVVRYEHDPKRFLAFAELACLHKTLRRLKPL